MRVLNLGSLNIDHVYKMQRFVQSSETLAAQKYETFAGGKGLNQSIAVARAGYEIYHAGKIGKGGDILKDCLIKSGINMKYICESDVTQGHALIQVNNHGENCIIVYSGSNNQIDKKYVDEVLEQFDENTYLMLQNEINNVEYIIDQAYEKNIKIVFNPSPVDDKISKIDFSKITWLLINEIEGKLISGKSDENSIISELHYKFPKLKIMLTLGEKGVMCFYNGEVITHGIYKMPVEDTTAAGDTFTGYFVAGLAKGQKIRESIQYASAAAAISVSRKGASSSIPTYDEVVKFLENK